MKKSIIVLLVLSCITLFILSGCFDKKEESNNVNINEYVEKKEEVSINKETKEKDSLYKEYSHEFDEKSALQKVEELSNLDSSSQVDDSTARKIYKLEDKSNYSIILRTNILDNKVHNDSAEIAIIKVPNTDENINAIKIASSRIKELKNTSNLGNDPYVIENTKGILTVVIASDARNITNLLTEELKVEG